MPERKRNFWHRLLWWRIEPDELNKQVAEYESMRRIQSAKGVSFFLLIFSACLTTALIVIGHSSDVAFCDALISLVLGYFIYRGHRWAAIAAMVFWSVEKVFAITAIWKVAGSSSDPFQHPVEQSVVQLVWWNLFMRVFYFAYRVEGLRRRNSI
jgi:hypothetical protein